ncbi:hypothetical protein SO802_022496 [Lithocarpus litseifolius]|uniref:Uncharacterized protein n=1 Tax=Lithocarpus litseifolius TaxID=425828 RepID=A0AAW2C5H4_9ROSI
MAGSSPLIVYAFFAACIFCQLFELVQAQNRTDPAEVTALNTIFQKWGILANSNQWNISGEPCSGAAIDSTDFEDRNFNPLIKCSQFVHRRVNPATLPLLKENIGLKNLKHKLKPSTRLLKLRSTY